MEKEIQDQPSTKKKWYASKTVITLVFTLGVTIASAYLGETNEFVAMAISAGTALGLYGRVIATKELTK